MDGSDNPDPIDVIVVGAGVAGCIVARRFVDAGRSVVVVEAGPGEPRPDSVTDADPLAGVEDQRWRWPELQASVADGAPPFPYRQGRGLGGGSAINAMLLAPGDRADYNRWATESGCGRWDADAMAPWLEAVARSWPSTTVTPGPVTEAFVAAAAAAGHPVIAADTLSADRLGILQARLAVNNGRRHSAYDQHLAPIVDRAGVAVRDDRVGRLTVMTESPVAEVVVDGRSARGVVLTDGTTVEADRVVVSCGAVHTPRLLMASGLTSVSDHPVRDHPSFAFTLALRDPTPSPVERSPLISRVLRWSAVSGSDRGDLQAFVIDRVDRVGPGDGDGNDGDRDQQPLAVVVVGLMSVSSVGRIGPGEPDSSGGGRFVTGALSTERDRRLLRRGVRHVLDLVSGPEMASLVEEVFVDDRGTPAATLRAMGDDELDRWLTGHPGPYAHPAASCPMGPMAPSPPGKRSQPTMVSEDPADGGRLVGFDGIHVIDASVIPQLVSAGLQVTVAAVAERLAAGLVAGLSEPESGAEDH